MNSSQDFDPTDPRREVISICQDLIRIPSINYGDRGDERAVAAYVMASLKEVGLHPELIVSGENRVNVAVRIPGSDRTRPGLVLHGHLDVVPADPAAWSVDPFGGEIKDGMIWGRGAVDMKDMNAMILSIVRSWMKTGYKPPRDVALVFFADEEAGGIFGSRWMVANRPDVFAGCDEAVSEVGGFSITLENGARLYLIETAEKGIQWLKLTAEGVAGHGSMINRDNAITELAETVARIGNYEWPIRTPKSVQELLEKVAEALGEEYDPANPDPLVAKLGPAARMIGATLRNTANPTMLEAGYKANVIPQNASAIVDGRFLPGLEQELLDTIASLVGENVTIETVTRDKSLETSFDGPMVDAMCAAILREDPAAIPVPYCMSGGTDNKALQELGIRGFGFSPLKLPADLDFTALFHGVDERVPIDALLFGTKVLDDFLRNC